MKKNGGTNMASVYCESNVSFSVNEEEQNALQKAHDIIEKIRHDWYVRDDNAWDNEDYWELENAVNMLEKLFKCKKNIN